MFNYVQLTILWVTCSFWITIPGATSCPRVLRSQVPWLDVGRTSQVTGQAERFQKTRYDWLIALCIYIYCIKSMYYISFYLYLYRYHSNKLVSTQVHIPAWLSKKRCDFDQHEGVKESTWWCEQQKWGVNPCGIHSGINFFPSDFLLVSNWIPIWTKRETDATDVFFRQFPGGTRVGTMIGPSKRTSERRPVRHRCSRTRKTGTNTNTWHH